MQLSFRKATPNDIDLYFEWSNDTETRQNSFNSEIIDYQTHTNWFLNKVADSNSYLLIFENNEKKPVGQVRIERKATENVIGISVNKHFRGLGLSAKMIQVATDYFFEISNEKTIYAYIKNENLASIKSFQKAGFNTIKEVKVSNILSKLLEKTNNGYV